MKLRYVTIHVRNTMIITDRFVMIHFPKTGTTFCRRAMKQLYKSIVSFKHATTRFEWFLFKTGLKRKPQIQFLALPDIRTKKKFGELTEHGTVSQIPAVYSDLPIVSVTRNPFERCVSMYEYRAWQRPPWLNFSYKKYFPNYPDLSFTEYMQLYFHYGSGPYASLPRAVKRFDVGGHTIHFIMFYAYRPYEVLEALDDDYIEQEGFSRDLAPVEFLHTENLNQELHDFFLRYGFRTEQVRFILDMEKKNVSRPKGRDWRNYFTQDLFDLVRYKERMLFKIFPQYLQPFDDYIL
ncbi:hypothetical protein GF339_00005 [candidate division KSB3 bacterium]|uniref:Sulfotransferase domain-containing protein n=1 Tax=candidate division KSB3 bacterium TaxID=2044937 RepID=A0A9D5JSS0_9BACT|nr:hypothetical protein [candidate division KSB3 bacterium]